MRKSVLNRHFYYQHFHDQFPCELEKFILIQVFGFDRVQRPWTQEETIFSNYNFNYSNDRQKNWGNVDDFEEVFIQKN